MSVHHNLHRDEFVIRPSHVVTLSHSSLSGLPCGPRACQVYPVAPFLFTPKFKQSERGLGTQLECCQWQFTPTGRTLQPALRCTGPAPTSSLLHLPFCGFSLVKSPETPHPVSTPLCPHHVHTPREPGDYGQPAPS